MFISIFIFMFGNVLYGSGEARVRGSKEAFDRFMLGFFGGWLGGRVLELFSLSL